MRTKSLALVTMLAAGSAAHADYSMWLESGGSSFQQVSPGESFALEVWLGSDAADVHDAAIWQIEFSAEGLLYEGYSWAAPYETGSIFDDSKPFIDDLPVLLDASTLSGGGYEQGVVDVELANLTMSGEFGAGWLATLELRVPLDYDGPDEIAISVVPDSFAMGFNEVPVVATGGFTLLVPAPGALSLLAITAIGAARRRH
jgi:hypothetical protein